MYVGTHTLMIRRKNDNESLHVCVQEKVGKSSWWNFHLKVVNGGYHELISSKESILRIILNLSEQKLFSCMSPFSRNQAICIVHLLFPRFLLPKLINTQTWWTNHISTNVNWYVRPGISLQNELPPKQNYHSNSQCRWVNLIKFYQDCLFVISDIL